MGLSAGLSFDKYNPTQICNCICKSLCTGNVVISDISFDKSNMGNSIVY